jgi:hypothetical protein
MCGGLEQRHVARRAQFFRAGDRREKSRRAAPDHPDAFYSGHGGTLGIAGSESKRNRAPVCAGVANASPMRGAVL